MFMKFLDEPPRFLFFVGKGGVGKTSIACAAAIQLSDDGKRVLLLSTDPASNIGQVFGTTIGNTITTIPNVKNLSTLEIDPQAVAQNYRDRIIGPIRRGLPEAIVKSIEEQLSGACTTEIASFDEFTSVLIDSELTKKYDHIIFDTAPTGHTLRLLQLPGAWTGFLEKGKGDASCLGPLAGLEKHREQYKMALDALGDSARTRFILVARAQLSTLREAARTYEELYSIGLSNQYLVINGILPEIEVGSDPLAASIWKREQMAINSIPEILTKLPQDYIGLKTFDLVGLDSLRLLFKEMPWKLQESSSHSSTQLNIPCLAKLVDSIAEDGYGLIMLVGKGGVGKTTIAAAIAVELAHRGLPVHLTTSDPAAHLAETLNGALQNLTVSRIDPHVENERYRQHVLETKGANLDAHGRALLEEDLRSPCTEEIAVFQAFSSIIREAGKKFVVMDTAPTGHTLLLLDATGSYHREVSRQLGKKNLHFVTPMMQLQDAKKTKIIIATLAEKTPVLEAANLQTDLRRAGIEPWAWVINNSLAAATTTSSLLHQRALNELHEIDTVTQNLSKRCAIVPLFKDEPVGVERLLNLARCMKELQS
jgi:arsenite-transporting ATPase